MIIRYLDPWGSGYTPQSLRLRVSGAGIRTSCFDTNPTISAELHLQAP